MSKHVFSIFPNENFVDLCMYQFGREQCDPAYSFGPATRSHYLFHYVLSGTGRLMTTDFKGQNHEYQIRSGQGFMIFPKQVTTYIADTDSRLPWEYVWIEFDGMRAREAVETAGLTPESPIYHATFKDLRENMVSEMQYIVEHRNETSFNLTGHLYLFLDFLSRRADARFLYKRSIKLYRTEFPERYIRRGHRHILRTEPHLFRADLQRYRRAVPAAVPAQLPHDQGRGTAETDDAVRQRYRKCRRLSEPAAFLKSIQKCIRDIPQRMAEQEPGDKVTVYKQRTYR